MKKAKIKKSNEVMCSNCCVIFDGLINNICVICGKELKLGNTIYCNAEEHYCEKCGKEKEEE